MKRWKISVAMIGLATGLLFSPSDIRRAHADDHERACSNKTLNGSFGVYRTGSTSTGPLAALGILFFDGNGTVFGSQSISRNGVFTFDQTTLGPYEVFPNCTGRGFLNGVEISRTVIEARKFFCLARTPAMRFMESLRKFVMRTTTIDRDVSDQFEVKCRRYISARTVNRY